MTSYRKFALTLLVALLPFTSFAQVTIPSNIQQLAQQVIQNPNDVDAIENLADALEALIEAEGLDAVDDIAEAIVSSADSIAQASALAEAVALAAVVVAADTPGTDVSEVVAEVARGARSGGSALGAGATDAIVNGVVAGATAGALQVGVAPSLVLSRIGTGTGLGPVETIIVPSENPAFSASRSPTSQG